MKLKQIKVNTNWASAAQAINENSQTIQIEFEKFLYGATNRGFFTSLDALKEAYPTANKGDIAFVYDSDGEQHLWWIYGWGENGWDYAGFDVPIETEVDLSGYLPTTGGSIVGNLNVSETITANQFKIDGGASDEILMADGITAKIGELGALLASETLDKNEYNEVF